MGPIALPWQHRSSGGVRVCARVCVFCCAGTVTSPPPRLIPRRHHCVSRPRLQLRFSFHLCHKFLRVEPGGGEGGIKPKTQASAAGLRAPTRGEGRRRREERGSRGRSPPPAGLNFTLHSAEGRGAETFCGLEGAPAAVPVASRGLQSYLRELGTDGETREADGQTGGEVALSPVCSGPSRGGSGRRERGSAGPVRGCSEGTQSSAALPSPLSPHSRICKWVVEGISGFLQDVFFIFLSVVLHGHAPLTQWRGMPTREQGAPSHPSPCAWKRPMGPSLTGANAAPQSLRDSLRKQD